MRTIRIALASGKGGTGKTTLATNLARVFTDADHPVDYLDCDVEEPNGHLFLKPVIRDTAPVSTLIPSVDPDKCTRCGECGRFCRYNAIVCLPKDILVFEQLCHGCGGCTLVCEAGAITETERRLGVVRTGASGNVRFVDGLLNIGVVMSPPLIHRVKSEGRDSAIQILDAPPGTACPVVASAYGADLVLLVTEPTPFGLHDLGLAVDLMRELDLPAAVVVNRATPGNRLARGFCVERGLEIMAEIPDDRRIAEAYSRGALAVEAVPDCRAMFEELADALLRRLEET